jgi:tetratricopeptide (TPR) repeat protein
MARLTLLLKHLESSPNDSFILFAIAKEYEGMEDYRTAMQYYTQLRSMHPNYVGTYYHLGKLYEKVNDPDSAMETYTTGMAIAKKENDHHAASELGGARMNLGDFEN